MGFGEFYFLLGAMLDVTDPDQTDPLADVVSRRMREKMLSRSKGRR